MASAWPSAWQRHGNCMAMAWQLQGNFMAIDALVPRRPAATAAATAHRTGSSERADRAGKCHAV